MHDSNITINLDVHPKFGFYEIKNGMKCEFMDLEGYYMVCNQDIGGFEKGVMYPIDHNNNDFIVYDNDEARKLAKKARELDDIELMYGFYEHVPVESFEDRTFSIIQK